MVSCLALQFTEKPWIFHHIKVCLFAVIANWQVA
ncbi:uncharacterized protein METZ01_LOCUS441027, partial [marine metagenome]